MPNIYNGSPHFIYDSLFEDNAATSSGCGGGALRLMRTPFTTYDADFNDRNNVIAPPKLVDRAAGNYRLAADSPCINAGMELGWHEGVLVERRIVGRGRGAHAPNPPRRAAACDG